MSLMHPELQKLLAILRLGAVIQIIIDYYIEIYYK